MEQSVFRVPMATREMEGVTRFADLLSFGATRCIFTGVSLDESVCGVHVPSRRSEVTLGFSSDTEYKWNQQTACPRPLRFIWQRLVWLAGFE